MKLLRNLLILLIILIGNNSIYAAETGCLLPNNQMFQNKINPGLINYLLGATPIYQNNAFIVLETECISLPKGSCRVCNGSFASVFGLITGCPTGFIYGSEVDYVLNCDIDSGNLFLLILSSGAGIWFIYKRQDNFI